MSGLRRSLRRGLLSQSGGSGGGGQLRASSTKFMDNASTGAIIALLTSYGDGSTYVTVGAVPPQLQLVDDEIRKTATAAVAGTTYPLMIRATSPDGKRQTAKTFEFRAEAAPQPVFTFFDGQPFQLADGSLLLNATGEAIAFADIPFAGESLPTDLTFVQRGSVSLKTTVAKIAAPVEGGGDLTFAFTFNGIAFTFGDVPFTYGAA